MSIVKNLPDSNLLNAMLVLKGWSLSKNIDQIRTSNQLVYAIDEQSKKLILTIKELVDSFTNTKYLNGYKRAEHLDIHTFASKNNCIEWHNLDKYVVFTKSDNSCLVIKKDQLDLTDDLIKISNENKKEILNTLNSSLNREELKYKCSTDVIAYNNNMCTSFNYLWEESIKENIPLEKVFKKQISRKKLNIDKIESLLNQIELKHLNVTNGFITDILGINIPIDKNYNLDRNKAFLSISDNYKNYDDLKNEVLNESNKNIHRNIMENYVKYTLEQILNISFISNDRSFLSTEKTNRDLNLELDGLNIEEKIAFEYQGHPSHWDINHPEYNSCKEKEDLKIQICNEHNIKLLIIPELKKGYKNFQYIVEEVKKILNQQNIKYEEKIIKEPPFFKTSLKVLNSLDNICSKYNMSIWNQDETGVTFEVANYKTPFLIKKSWSELRKAIDNQKLNELFNEITLNKASLTAWYLKEKDLSKSKPICFKSDDDYLSKLTKQNLKDIELEITKGPFGPSI